MRLLERIGRLVARHGLAGERVIDPRVLCVDAELGLLDWGSWPTVEQRAYPASPSQPHFAYANASVYVRLWRYAIRTTRGYRTEFDVFRSRGHETPCAA